MARGKYHEWLTDEGLTKLEGWARDGLTDEEIAGKIGINPATLYVWKNKYSAICEALKKGKEVIDYQVEQALLKKALGHTTLVKKTFKVKRVDYNKETGKRTREYEELVEGYDEVYTPPDTLADIFWLKNRKPDVWRDKQEIKHEGELNVTSPFDEISSRINGIADRIGKDKDTK